MKSPNFFLFSLLWLMISCQDQEDALQITKLTSPAGVNSELPNLFTSAKGEIYLSWVDQKSTSSRLLYSKLKDGQWQPAQIISEGNNWFVNWADFPSLIASDDFMAAHWLQKSAEGTYDYDVHIATSKDGKTWSESFKPYQDTIKAEHGFVSMLTMPNEQFFATWLDGRNTKMMESTHTSSMDHKGAMTLRAGVFSSNGKTLDTWELDNRTCDCCQTAAVMAETGPIVVYRDRSTSEIRDIFITRLEKEQWTKPKAIANDLWKIAGCPVNGPDITIANNILAVVWYTAAGNTPKVQLTLSDDLGTTFKPPILLSEGNPLGRVGITTYEGDKFLVSWLEQEKEDAIIMLALLNQKGDLLKKINLAKSSLERASGFPVITSNGSTVIAAWTSIEETKKIQTVSIEF